jgi:hypothetical protein
MIGSSVNSPICGVNGLFYLKVQCKITAAVFLTLRWYLSDNVARNTKNGLIQSDQFRCMTSSARVTALGKNWGSAP